VWTDEAVAANQQDPHRASVDNLFTIDLVICI
jgi:hypothetical protein